MKARIILLALPLSFMLHNGHSATAAPDYPVAGTTPWQRPEVAPVIEWVQREQAWYEKSLTGVLHPYPRSLYFLENQGYWYTPFVRPGMLPPYDLRGWHQ